MTVSTAAWTGWVIAEASTSGWLVIPLDGTHHPTMLAVRGGKVVAVFVRGRNADLTLDQRAWAKAFTGGQAPTPDQPMVTAGPLVVLVTGPHFHDRDNVRELFA